VSEIDEWVRGGGQNDADARSEEDHPSEP
jgi:hypothetical protein